VLDHVLADDDNWVSKVKREDDQEHDSLFDDMGEHKHRSELMFKLIIQLDCQAKTLTTLKSTFMLLMLPEKFIKLIRKHLSSTRHVFVRAKACLTMKLKQLKRTKEDLKANTAPAETKPKCRSQFLHVPIEKIRKTFTAMTQNAASVVHGPKANQTLKSPNPALNIRRRKEPAAMDSIFADVPAVDTPGCAGAQMFVGRTSFLTNCYGFCSVSEFANALLDNIRERGAMDMLISNHTNCEMSAEVKDILRALMIGHWKIEPCCQHQNFAEHRWGHVKANLEWLVAFSSLMSIQIVGCLLLTAHAAL